MSYKMQAFTIIIIFILLLSLYIPLSEASSYWSKTYGVKGDNEARCAIQTTDDGFILAGFTNSSGNYDALIIKTDETGNVEWNKTFGGTNYDKAFSIIQTTDGGFLFGGESSSINERKEWLVKLDSSGNKQWEKTYPRKGEVLSIFQMNDGYVIGSNWGIQKIDKQGETSWSSHTDDYIFCITKSSNDDLICLGQLSASNADLQTYFIKFDSSGEQLLKKIYEPQDWIWANSIIQTNEGNFAFTGYTMIDEGSYSTMTYSMGIIDSEGNLQWTKTYTGPGEKNANSDAHAIIQTTDGGYAIAGDASPYSDKPNSYKGNPYWLVKLNSAGDMQWNQMYYGLAPSSVAYSLIQTNDNGFVLCGKSGGTISTNEFLGFVWLLKTGENGESQESESPYTSPTPKEIKAIPTWAFNGAYAVYSTSVLDSGIEKGVEVTLAISNINLQTNTCVMSISNNASISALSLIFNDFSLTNPQTMLAGVEQLSSLNNGEFPTSSSDIKVTTKQLVFVPAGTFMTDKIAQGTLNIQWYDMYSGIVIKASQGIIGNISTSSDFVLTKTNICPTLMTKNLTFNMGKATFDSTSTTGVKVEISDSEVVDGAQTLVLITSFGDKFPTAVNAIQVNGIAFYDVQVMQTTELNQDAMGTIYITNSAFTEADGLSYWDNNGWVSCSTSFNAPNTLVASVPVSALTGTLFVVTSNTDGVIESLLSVNNIMILAILAIIILAVAISFISLKRRNLKTTSIVIAELNN